MVVTIEIVLLIIFGFLLLYLALLSILALTARKPFPMTASRYRQLAVIVPAHDEELSIENTLKSLFAVDYPRDCFDVIVIADNCADRTGEIARNRGAVVYERQNHTFRGKGYALQWCFDLLLSGRCTYDGIVVVDADSIVSSNFLSVMNFYLENGAQAIQCSDMVKPRPGAWSAEVTRVGFTLYNYVRPLGRRVIGCSAGLRGNGMCFAADTLRRVPWQAYSLTEDLEYGLVLLLSGISVVFAPEATVHATMPQSADNAESQRARWETGRFPIIRRYAGRLLGTSIRRASFRAFDAFIDLVTPPFVNLLASVTVLLLVNFFLWRLGIEKTAWFTGLWLIPLALCVVHVFVGLYSARADESMYKALLYSPRYALWKLRLYVKLLYRGQAKNWIRTTRESSHEHQEASGRVQR